VPPSSPLASLFALEARERVRCDMSVFLKDFCGRAAWRPCYQFYRSWKMITVWLERLCGYFPLVIEAKYLSP